MSARDINRTSAGAFPSARAFGRGPRTNDLWCLAAVIVVASIRVFVPEAPLITIIASGAAVLSAVTYPHLWSASVLLAWVLPQVAQPGGENRMVSAGLLAALPFAILRARRLTGASPLRSQWVASLVVVVGVVGSYLWSGGAADLSSTVARCIAVCVFVVGTEVTRGNRGTSTLLVAIGASGVLLALHTLMAAQSFAVIRTREFYENVGDPNYLALYIVIATAPLTAAVASSAVPWTGRLLAATGLVLTFVAVAQLGSRMGGFLFVASSAAVLMHVVRGRRLRGALAVVLMGCVMLVGLAVAGADTYMAYLDRWSDRDVSALGGRSDIALDAARFIGSATFSEIVVGGGAWRNFAVLGGWNAHNSYLEFFIDHGIFGLGGLLALMVLSWRRVRGKRGALASVARAELLIVVVAAFAVSPFVYYWPWFALIPCWSVGSPDADERLVDRVI